MRLSVIALGLVVLLLLAMACGGGNADVGRGPAADAAPSHATPNTPDVFMTFEGNRYKVVDVVLASSLPRDQLREIGVVDKADIRYQAPGAEIDIYESGPLKVYRRQGDAVPLYTFSPFGGGVPALWVRWSACATAPTRATCASAS
ncbi:MAG: hypothetical protein Q8Q00_10475 [Dehalococcoidia bacterium]|nr:hypothetical protein [Dehalococcoidia bacterium]